MLPGSRVCVIPLSSNARRKAVFKLTKKMLDINISHSTELTPGKNASHVS